MMGMLLIVMGAICIALNCDDRNGTAIFAGAALIGVGVTL